MRNLLIIFTWLIATMASAQIERPVTWTYTFAKEEVKQGETVDLLFTASIQDDWYLYSSDFDPNLGPQVATFELEKHPSVKAIGKVKAIKPKKKYDDIFGGDYTYFEDKGEFVLTVKILQANPKIVVEFNGQACRHTNGRCTLPNETFTFPSLKVIASATPSINNTVPNTVVVKESIEDSASTAQTTASQASIDTVAKQSNIPNKSTPLKQDKVSLWDLILLALSAGLVALITPCVFPMIPLTVTFFLKSSKTRSEAISKAIIYGISIVTIYAILGILFSILFGPGAANTLATHWLPNIVFFIVFFIFGISFLGAFDIVLPSSFVNKVDAKSDQGGLLGIFFMAFAIVLVTFSCTAPIVGSVLVLAFDGKILRPVVGMIAYASAFAIPFTLFALFPSWLSKLPKSGGWLNVVKVSLGFVELALGLKFLSIVDQVYHWHILDREIYLAIWIVLFTLLGIYLLGKIRMPHDSPVEKTSVGRLILAVASFTFVVYLIPGMFGAPLKALSGYLPPLSAHDFDIPSIIRKYSGGTNATTTNELMLCEEPKYASDLHLPHGIKGYFDYKQAIACAKKLNKPLFIDFTGHGCVNCREMEANVWSDPTVLNMLKKDFLVVALYVDDPMRVQESDIYTSSYDGKKKKTLGAQNADRQITQFNNNAQPYYVLLDPNTEQALNTPVGYEKSVPTFVKFLEDGKEKFGK